MQRTLRPFSLALSLLAFACGGGDGDQPGTPDGGGAPDALAYVPGTVLKVKVSGTFPAGTALRDGYSGESVTVNSDGNVSLTPGANGVVLLEPAGATAGTFRWHNVTVYHAIVDRYANGDTGNDESYGRKKDGQMEIGTWHGGDWKGLTGKLDYLADLGVTALWVSPIVENVHGWVSGGSSGAFKHWGYHGYWALDYTKLDKNLGSEADLQALIDGAHARGMRVLLDVVVNHPGYATGGDLTEILPEVFRDGTGAAFKDYDKTATANYARWNDLVDYKAQGWKNWWSPKSIRSSDFPDYPRPGTDDQTKQLDFLPDFLTEVATPTDTPVLFTRKADTAFVRPRPGFTVRQYLVKWQTDWVRKFGFDGFRVDTVKNVDRPTFKALKEAGLTALADWKTANPGEKLDDAPFWMTAEDFGHGVSKDNLYTDGGFDSVINFKFQSQLSNVLQTNAQLVDGVVQLDATYTRDASAIADPTFGILSYISSHDTRLNFDYFKFDVSRQRQAGTALLLMPGGVEIFYGDESGRRGGPTLGDPTQPTRSDMNFASSDDTILQHWKRIATFRKKHPAVGAGVHARIDAMPGTYAFSRTLDADKVVVILVGTR